MLTETALLRTRSGMETVSVVLHKTFKHSPRGTKKGGGGLNKSIDMQFWKEEDKDSVKGYNYCMKIYGEMKRLGMKVRERE